MSAILPGEPALFSGDTTFAVDSLVEAILDAVDPNVCTVSSRLTFGDAKASPVIVVRMNAAQWELAPASWARVAGELSIRSRGRPLTLPSLAGVMDTLMDGGMAAFRRAAAYGLRGAH